MSGLVTDLASAGEVQQDAIAKQVDKTPPWQRVLTGDDAKKVEEIEKRIDELILSGRFAEALRPAEEIVEIRTHVQGTNHWQSVDARRKLELCRVLRDRPSAERVDYTSSVKLKEDARQFLAKAQYKQAEPLLRRVLEIRRRVLGDEHPDTAHSYHNVGGSLFAQRRYAEAEPFFSKSLEILHDVLEEDHPETAVCYTNAAGNLQSQGKPAEAEPLFQKALEISRRVLGEDDHVAKMYNNAAFNLSKQGKYAEAEPLFLTALAICRRVLGEDHPSTALAYNSALKT
jgi:tetratricopeptide (TPR) repeat protein